MLAESCEVSRRTIYRDLHTLEAAGIPVRYRADAGGYEISPGFFLESPHLEESEAVSLVIQAMRPSPPTGPDRGPATYRAIQKIAQALPDGIRQHVVCLVEALRGDAEPRDADPDRARIHEALINALARKQTLRIWVREPGGVGVVATKISPVRLAVEGDSWRVTGRSTLHRRVETIRVAWIIRAIETGEPSLETRPGSPTRPSQGARITARLRFDAWIAPEILDGRWPRDRQLELREDGSLDMALSIEDADVLAGWILGLGDRVEVLGPASLRDRIRETARRVARLNASPTDRAEANPLTMEAVGR